MPDVFHWVTNPLNTSTRITLLFRSLGLLKPYDRKFDTAYLIAIGCLDSSLCLTEKGRDALLFYFEGSPNIAHLESETCQPC